ncbi:transposable element Tc3 transposase [Trichonephila clavipes]|uniref:Transposable element Tc3 transposase n=1 Tax=Trichonephila clavipes TaxID=2585209 RepID=A0A8X7BF46_TRICX|nr:transposable element Tc3 transposase [Trichonephila clavipes]
MGVFIAFGRPKRQEVAKIGYNFPRCIHYKHNDGIVLWIPSYVNIAGNEIARADAGETTMPATPLTYLELFPKHKAKNKAIRMNPPVHPWHQSKCPCASLVRGSSRRDQTALTRFLSGHLMSLTSVDGIKHFEICIKCSSAQASPGHILPCLGLTR